MKEHIKMPVYLYENMEFVSAGVVFYRIRRGAEFLFMEKQDKKGQTIYEDPGGKSNAEDDCIEAVAAREAAEELNGKIQDPMVNTAGMSYQERIDASRDYILRLIREKPRCIPNSRIKYATFLVHLPYFKTGTTPPDSPKGELDPRSQEIDFGDRELHPKYVISRRVRWFTAHDLATLTVRQIHPRVRHVVRMI